MIQALAVMFVLVHENAHVQKTSLDPVFLLLAAAEHDLASRVHYHKQTAQPATSIIASRLIIQIQKIPTLLLGSMQATQKILLHMLAVQTTPASLPSLAQVFPTTLLTKAHTTAQLVLLVYPPCPIPVRNPW